MNTNGRLLEPPSLPLYLAGGVITLCGIFAADATLAQPDPGWVGRTSLLAALGFVFSYGCRQLEIKAQAVDFGFAVVLLLLLAGIAGGQVALEQFLPLGADSNTLRLIAALVWGGTVLAWGLRSDTRVMMTTIPAMAALGLAAEVDLNDPVLVCFGVFILTVIFLLIHQNFLQNRVRAATEERRATAPRLLLAQFAQAGLCGLAVLLLGLVVIIPAQAVFSRLSLAQAIRRLAAIKSTPIAAGTALRFSDDDNLQIGTGAAWSSSAEVVMQVTPSDGREHYWRGRTYDQYTGLGWQSSLEENKARAEDGGPIAGGQRYFVPPGLTPGDGDNAAAPMTTMVRVLGDTSQFYYAADAREIILGSETARYNLGARLCRDGRLDLVSGGPVRYPYVVVSQPAPDAAQPETQDRLRRAGTDYPPEVRQLYLSTRGEGVTQAADMAFFQRSVAEAVQALPPDRRDPLDEVLALRDWVSRRCVYSLAPPPIPDSADHVHYFLDDKRLGYCDMFASSLAVLCRTAGIPARLATGFAPGDPNGSSFNLRGEDKHAWTEAYFPGTGWVAFDATAGASTDGSVPRAGGQAGAGWLGWLARLRASLGTGGALILPLLAGIGLILSYVLKTEVYDRWRAKHPSQARVHSLPAAAGTGLGRQYERLTRTLARLGLPRRPSETSNEHAARVVALLPALEQEFGVSLSRPLVTALTAAFTEACYGRPGVSPGSAEKWNGSLAQLESAARRVFWRRLWRRFTRFYPGAQVRRPSLEGEGLG